MTTTLRAWLVLFVFLTSCFASVNVTAQTYPSKPVTIIVPYGPGSGIDMIARELGPRLT
jgi:tripartite-type tricarboxylate transporter receptor subunit TctC